MCWGAEHYAIDLLSTILYDTGKACKGPNFINIELKSWLATSYNVNGLTISAFGYTVCLGAEHYVIDLLSTILYDTGKACKGTQFPSILNLKVWS